MIPFLSKPRGKHAAARHATPKRATRRAERFDDDARDEDTMALFAFMNRPAQQIVLQLVGATLTATGSIDAALRMTEMIRRQALAGAR